MFANIVMAGAALILSAGADSVEEYPGMCGPAVEALQAIESAPVGEIPAAVNAVYEADMRCAYGAADGHHRVYDLDSALGMCAAEDVADTRECAEWALAEY